MTRVMLCWREYYLFLWPCYEPVFSSIRLMDLFQYCRYLCIIRQRKWHVRAQKCLEIKYCHFESDTPNRSTTAHVPQYWLSQQLYLPLFQHLSLALGRIRIALYWWPNWVQTQNLEIIKWQTVSVTGVYYWIPTSSLRFVDAYVQQ